MKHLRFLLVIIITSYSLLISNGVIAQTTDSLIVETLRQSNIRFSHDNSVTLLLSGQEKFDDMFQAIRQARQAAEALKAAPQKEECTFDEFEKMDIRTATVLEAERVPKTDKLLKLTIDTGIDKRVIVSGIAEYYTPEQMLGRQICILANLKPRVIRGIESKGMILMAKQGDGKMRFVTPEETVVNGAQIG